MHAFARPDGVRQPCIEMGAAFAARRVFAWRPHGKMPDTFSPVFIVPVEEWFERMLAGEHGPSGRAWLVDVEGVSRPETEAGARAFSAIDLCQLADAPHHHAAALARLAPLRERVDGRQAFLKALAGYLTDQAGNGKDGLCRETLAFVESMRMPSYGTLRQRRQDVDLAEIATDLAQAGLLERHLTPVQRDDGPRGTVVTFYPLDMTEVGERVCLLDLVLTSGPTEHMLSALFERRPDAAMKVALRSIHVEARATLDSAVAVWFASNAPDPFQHEKLAVAMTYTSILRSMEDEAVRDARGTGVVPGGNTLDHHIESES